MLSRLKKIELAAPSTLGKVHIEISSLSFNLCSDWLTYSVLLLGSGVHGNLHGESL